MNRYKSILIGTLLEYGLTLVFLLIFSVLLVKTNIRESVMDIVIKTVSVLSIFTGSVVANLKTRKNGVLNGAIIGVIYIISLYLISSFLNDNFSINMTAFAIGLLCLFTGAIGGLIGVNLNRKIIKNNIKYS